MERSQELAAKAYFIINEKANSNSVIQGLSGVLGFPFTIIADGATIITHYGAMLNEIRALYGRNPVNESVLKPIVSGVSSELIFDLVADKVLGNVPLIGIYFNAICAKTMTWRLGIIFAMLASRGESVEGGKVKEMAQLIRQVFPQADTFKFKQPSYDTFEKLIVSVHNNNLSDFNHKITSALEVFK